ncbi:cytochrome C oxidase subunit IV family protein [Flaviaesturariibacter amylovorans]|uniref:Cytochrome C oxidase subunit IV n=1 Tax=Flaviaesturariibacter amylovorans TaxID=1084520 RepID=A0ABP8HQP4_9BACT
MAHNLHSNTHSPEITYHHEPSHGTSRIWKTTIILSVLTVIELGLGLAMYAMDMSSFVLLLLKGVICILTIAKAFYIVSIFMHLGDEIRNMIMTIVMPLLLFVWFIAAFLWDGNSFRTLRNRYDKYYQETTMQHEMKKADTTRATGLH